MTVTDYISVLKESVKKWSEDNAPRLGAAIAFYSMLSMGPLFLLFLRGADLIYGHEAAQGQLLHQIDSVVGREGSKAIQDMLTNAHNDSNGTLASLIGIVVLLVGASGVFGELITGLNQVWHVKKQKHEGIWHFLRQRFLSFSMVLGAGFMLLISLILSTVLSALNFGNASTESVSVAASIVNMAVSFSVTMGLFACIFRYIPSARVAWSDVWEGAAITSLLFALGKFAIGFYLGHSAIGSAYGAAGSLVVMLVWIYYSAQILYFGAEVTYVIAERKAQRAS